MSWELIGYVEHRILNADQADEDYDRRCRRAWTLMTSAQREVLAQLVRNGPIWDGDIASKAGRDDLLVCRLASRACVKGEQGYTVATYRGWDVFKSAVT
jgi:hypothetical protein